LDEVPTLRLRVREIRQAIGWSQRQLAAKAGVRQATISSIERGEWRSIDLDVLDRLAHALNVDPAILFVRYRADN
jgi:transcriptional regulator with XRE-family HTH domain